MIAQLGRWLAEGLKTVFPLLAGKGTFLFVFASRHASQPTQPTIECKSGDISREERHSEREMNTSSATRFCAYGLGNFTVCNTFTASF
jgi:hypothetical protein